MLGFLGKVVSKFNRLMGVNLPKTHLYRISKTEVDPVRKDRDGTLDRGFLSPEHVDRLLAIGPFDKREGLRRLERGDLCYTVYVDGRLAHYSWVQRSGSHLITEAAITLPVERGEFWIYDCRTGDRARGKRIYPATLERIVDDHFAQGYRTAWIYTNRENTASQKGILRAGFLQVATLSALRVGGCYFRLRRSSYGQ